MSAENFPITFGYKATDNVYYGPHGSIGPYHRGEDRAMPDGTPVIVNGVQIGLSGHSGAASGPHLHIGRFMGGVDTAPNGGGFHFVNAVVTQVSSDATNGDYVRVQADGASWVYLHLSKQTVAQGQVLVATPPPAPVTPVVHPYTVETIPSKVIKINKNTHKWGLNYDNLAAIQANPEGTANAGDSKTVVAILHHNIGYSYYLENATAASGYNILDCDDLPAVPYTPPASPVLIPTDTTPYKVVKLMDGYLTSNRAINRILPPDTPVAEGSYFAFNKKYENDDPAKKLLAVNVTKTPGVSFAWINVEDNVPEPEPVKQQPVTVEQIIANRSPDPKPEPVVIPEPPAPTPLPDSEAQIRTSIQWFNPESHSPIQVRALEKVKIAEALGKSDKTYTLQVGDEYHVYGTFEKDGNIYALFRIGRDTHFDFLFSCRIKSRTDIGPYLEDIYSVAEKLRYGVDLFVNSLHKTIEGIFHPKKRK